VDCALELVGQDSVMSDAATSPNLAVYQLRVVMVGISPLIWRRLLIPADTGYREFWTGLRRQSLFSLVNGVLSDLKHGERFGHMHNPTRL
jgi:hypothetical protein